MYQLHVRSRKERTVRCLQIWMTLSPYGRIIFSNRCIRGHNESEGDRERFRCFHLKPNIHVNAYNALQVTAIAENIQTNTLSGSS